MTKMFNWADKVSTGCSPCSKEGSFLVFEEGTLHVGDPGSIPFFPAALMFVAEVSFFGGEMCFGPDTQSTYKSRS